MKDNIYRKSYTTNPKELKLKLRTLNTFIYKSDMENNVRITTYKHNYLQHKYIMQYCATIKHFAFQH